MRRIFMDGTELHILNGDCSSALWKECGFQGQSLVWRETYLEGPLPDTDDLRVFREARAEYLSRFDELSGIDPSRLCRHLQNMDEAVLFLPDGASLVLWFDACIFDQTILMRILSLLSRNPNDIRVFLYCCDSCRLDKADFMTGQPQPVPPHDRAAAGEAWRLFVRKDASGIMELLKREPFEHLPKMKKALQRCMEEFPDRNGLTGTQRHILKLAADGRRAFAEIFKIRTQPYIFFVIVRLFFRRFFFGNFLRLLFYFFL